MSQNRTKIFKIDIFNRTRSEHFVIKYFRSPMYITSLYITQWHVKTDNLSIEGRLQGQI